MQPFRTAPSRRRLLSIQNLISIAILTFILTIVAGCDMGTYEKRANESPETNPPAASN